LLWRRGLAGSSLSWSIGRLTMIKETRGVDL
jgi:hypothetical protein